MSESIFSPQTWMGAVEESAREFVNTTFAKQECAVLDQILPMPEAVYGAFVSLTGKTAEAILGVFGDPLDCHRVAGDFMGLQEDEAVTDDDAAGIMAEIANILAGGVKLRVAGLFPGLRIGIPYFLNGALQIQKPIEVTAMRMRWGASHISFALVIRKHAEEGDPAC
jgi:hypothetical protein